MARARARSIAPRSDGGRNLGASGKQFGEVNVKILKLDGTEVTPTAAQLNVLKDVTAGTAAASKAVVLDAAKHIDEVNTAKLSLGATGSVTEVTASAAELNVLNDVVAGTASASKAVVLDSNSHVDAVKTAALHVGATGAETQLGDIDQVNNAATFIEALSATQNEVDAAATYVDTLDVPVAEMNSGYALIGALAGTGGAGTAAFDTTGPVEVVAANTEADKDRACLIIVECTHAFSVSGSTYAKFEIGDGQVAGEFATIGEDGTPDESMEVGDKAVFTGTLTKERPMQITITTGDGDAGAIQVYVIALDVEA